MSKLIIIDARESGTSTGRYIDKLIEYLHKLKPEFDFTILTKSHRLDYFKNVAPSFRVIESPFKEFTFSEQLGFKTQLDNLNADLVHFGMVQQPVRYKGAVVTTIHDLITVRFKNPAKNPIIFYTKQQVYKWVIGQALRKSKKVIVPSKFVKQDLVSFYKADPKKITVTYESSDEITDKATPLKSLEHKKFIMYLGRPTPHKNLGRLIEAFVLLQTKHPKLCLVLAGKKDFNYSLIEKSANARNIKNIIFTDFVSEGELRWLYENCRAYVVPSLSEGFGLPGLEAMRHSAAVVSSNATVLPEIYGQAANYFNPLNVEDMSKSIDKVLSDERFRQKLIADGIDQVKKYSWNDMAKKTLEVYKEVLA